MKMLKMTAVALALAAPSFAAAQTTVTVDPIFVDLFSDQAITARLTEGGYSDIMVTREGDKLMIDASKDGTKHHLVYDMTSGALTEVDGAGYEIGAAGATAEGADSSTDEKKSDKTSPSN